MVRLALAHNGNLINSAELRNELMQHGVGFSSSSDTEVMTMMLARNGGATWEERIKTAMKKWVGAYSLVILTRDCVYAVRDPWGFRPLAIGLLPSGGHAVASETGALQTLGCEAIRDVKPGEVVSLSNNALKVMQALPSVRAFGDVCVRAYLLCATRPNMGRDQCPSCAAEAGGRVGARDDSDRKRFADVVIPVPDSVCAGGDWVFARERDSV